MYTSNTYIIIIYNCIYTTQVQFLYYILYDSIGYILVIYIYTL